MSQYTIKVSPTLTDNANYKGLTDIPADILTQSDVTVLVYPGTYTAPTNAVLSDVAFVGIGDREEIVVSGDMTIANTSSGTITFENLTFRGANAAVTSSSTNVTKLGAASTKLHFKHCNFDTAEYAIRHNGTLAFAGATKQVVLDFVDATAVDKALVANANVSINYSALNTGSNAYFTPGTGGGSASLTLTVRASTSGGSNTGLNTETVLALIS